MASITREKNGRRTIQFVGADGKRRSIRLGKVSQRTAEAIKTRVELLNTARIAGHAVDGDTAGWVASLDAVLADKLAAVGLIPRRARATLGDFLASYIDKRQGTDVKPATVTVWGHVRRNLVDYFGPDKPLRDITPGDADDWRRWLGAEQGLGENTIRKRCQFAKMFLRAAVKHRLIGATPFAELKGKVQANPTRTYFVTREEARKVIDACPDAQWRLLFALSRYGGLRCPSEHLGLRWGDVDWERSRITVRSPKTEHHQGGDRRQVPIFPELRPHLEAVWDQAEPGAEYVITRYRNTNANLRTQLLRIIDRAGVEPWPKLFHNLRATRETELAETYPLHVVCAWIGNSQAIAARHYLQVTDAHFQQAAEAGAEAVQNPVQSAHATSRKPSQAGSATPVFAEECDTLRYCADVQVEDRGLEPLTFWLPARRSPN
jgi:integrase